MEEKIKQIIDILKNKSEEVGQMEMTKNNFDNKGVLIDNPIPTVTTSIAEIGGYNNTIYFVIIFEKQYLTRNNYELLKEVGIIRVYGFKNFKKDLCLVNNLNLEELNISKEKFFQVEYDFDIKLVSVESIIDEYFKIKNVLIENNIPVINQLKWKIE